MLFSRRLFLAFGLFIFMHSEALASHAAGMELSYRHVSGNTYEFTMYYFNNCLPGASSPPTFFQLYARSASLGISNKLVTNLVPIGACTQSNNFYNCTNAALCYIECVYRGQVNLDIINPGNPNATDWIFYTELCCRPSGLPATPANLAYGSQYVECGLNNKDFPAGNTSPFFHASRPNIPGHLTDTVINYLMRTVCEGNYYTLDMSTTEFEGDSVSYSFFHPQDAGGVPAAYINGYCFSGCLQGPMPTYNPPLTINPFTGIIPIIPGAPNPSNHHAYVLGIKATEWRYDTIVFGGAFTVKPIEIGFVKRDLTIWIDDSTTCRRDSAHPKDIVISNGGGDTIVDVYFHSGKTGDPNSLVRCETLSPDGSEFRILDSTSYIPPFDTTVRSIGVNRAVWDCNLSQGSLTDKVTLHLSEPLKCQEYWVLLKKGSDLDVIESECGFLEEEFQAGKLIVQKNVQVKADSILKKVNTVCLPTTDPFPKLNAWSQDSTSFPLSYFWAFNGDTVAGQNVPFIWANQSGSYKVLVRDPYNCTGADSIQIYFRQTPDFRFEAPLYCDKYGQPKGLPEFITAPNDTNVYKWEWYSSLGLMGTGDTLRKPELLENITYTLRGYTDSTVAGMERCVSEVSFTYNRENFPPQTPLWVDFGADPQYICIQEEDTGRLSVWEDGVRQTHAPLQVQWFYQGLPVEGNELSRTVSQEGKYGIFVQDSLGCYGLDSVNVFLVNAFAGPEIPCKVEPDLSGRFEFTWPVEIQDGLVENEVSLDGGKTWFPANGGYFHEVTNVISQGNILGRGLFEFGCEYSEVSVSNPCPNDVFPPNVITPNGDGVNDLFTIRGLDLFNSSKLEIFDRWGNRIFQADDYQNNWDGGNAPEGTYFYVLQVDDVDQTVHRGTLTVLR